MTTGAWVICIVSGFLGVILGCYKVAEKNDTSARDNAVEKVYKQHISKQ